MKKPKLVRITTVPISLNLLIRGQMKFMREKGFEVLTASADGPEIAEVTEREGVSHTLFPMTRKITPYTDTKALWQLTSWFREVRPDIVHSHTPKAGLLAMTAARLAGVPHRLHTVAGMPLMETTGVKRSILNLTESQTYRFATRVYPNSSALRDFIAAEFPSAIPKLKVIGKGSSNGIDTSHFQRTPEVLAEADSIRKKYHLTDNRPVFCFVGRMVRDKGINELIAAFLKVLKKTPSARLLLVGPYEHDLDPLLPETHQEIQRNDAIITAGFQKDIRPFLAASDIFVFPSYREGFPNVVLQASCMRLPCIVTDINGCNELITDGENGLIVPPKDAEALENAMHTLAEHSELREAYGKEARERVVADYEQAAIWEQLYEEYNALLNV
jgi:glycosyltransferase involved in cell wall biosynthesis